MDHPWLWIALTIAAAFGQNIRSLLQKRLTGELSVNGASYVRFLYALPFAWLYLVLLGGAHRLPFASDFLGYCLLGGIAQVAATSALVGSFESRNFAVGTALSKTETVQAALFGLVLLGESLSAMTVAAIAISFVGVLLLSSGRSIRELLVFDRAAVLGLVAGAGFAIAAVSYRGAALSLPEGSVVLRAAMTLAVTLTIQVMLMAVYLRAREPGQVGAVWSARRRGWPVGLIGMLSSAGWFTAMALVSAALVRAVGQIELLFAFATSVWILRERVRGIEVAGALLVLCGILLILMDSLGGLGGMGG